MKTLTTISIKILLLFTSVFLAAIYSHAGEYIKASSEYSTGHKAAYAFDGNVQTRWANKQHGEDGWVSYDFGRSVSFQTMSIQWQDAFALEYSMQSSDNGKEWTDVYQQKSGKGGIEELKGLNFKGRYLRILCTKSCPIGLYSIREVSFTDPEPTAAIAQQKIEIQGKRRKSLGSLHSKLDFDKLVVVHRHHIQSSHVYAYHAEGFLPGGGIYVYDLGTDSRKKIFDAGQGEVMDLSLSYDGTELVFSFKKTDVAPDLQHNRNFLCGPSKDPEHMWQIYRMNIDGSNLKQITTQLSNNFSPCWLPDGDIAFLTDRKGSMAYCFSVSTPLLYRMDRDGKKVKRLSLGYLADATPSVTPDGKIMFTRWEYVDRAAAMTHGLWTINPDGTNLQGYFGNRVIEPGVFMWANPIKGASKVLCLLTNHNGDCSGAIGVIDPRFGSNSPKGIHNLTPEIELLPVDQGNSNAFLGRPNMYLAPYPVDENYLMATQADELFIRSFDGKERIPLLMPENGMGWYYARPLRETKRPPVMVSMLPENPSSEKASVFMQDVYNGLDPKHVKHGEVKQICIVEEVEKSVWMPILNETPSINQYAANLGFGFLFPLTSCGATHAPKKVWGSADVYDDGSAYFEVPAGVPVSFLALDKEGRAVQRMRTFTHFQPGEVQSCVGCHADRNMATQTASGTRTIAMQKGLQKLSIPEWGLKNFDYSSVVQPVLDKYCLSCHNERERPGGIDLSGDKTDFFSVSYENLARKGSWGEKNPYVHDLWYGENDTERKKTAQETVGFHGKYIKWIAGINGTEWTALEQTPKYWGSYPSKLTELVLNGHPGKDGEARFNMDDASIKNLMLWMDLNVPYYDTIESNYPDRVGCRRIYPVELEEVLKEIETRRNVNLPRTFYVRILKPENNIFLIDSLAKSAGGTAEGSTAVFKTKDDPDYQKILGVFESNKAMLKEKPRMDMVREKPVIKHRFLAVDESRKQLMLVDEFNPRNDWTIQVDNARDIQKLTDNRILVSTLKGYYEYRITDGKLLKKWLNSSLVYTATRLPDGRTLLGRNHDGVTFTMLDKHDSVVSEFSLKGESIMRLARITPHGNYLFGSNSDQLVEVNPHGEVVDRKKIPGSSDIYEALRKKNGNTLLTSGYGSFFCEIDSKGNMIRKIDGKELSETSAGFFAGFQALGNGNTVVVNWHGHEPASSDKGFQILEFDKNGKLVWHWHNPKRAGSLDSVLILQ